MSDASCWVIYISRSWVVIRRWRSWLVRFLSFFTQKQKQNIVQMKEEKVELKNTRIKERIKECGLYPQWCRELTQRKSQTAVQLLLAAAELLLILVRRDHVFAVCAAAEYCIRTFMSWEEEDLTKTGKPRRRPWLEVNSTIWTAAWVKEDRRNGTGRCRFLSIESCDRHYHKWDAVKQAAVSIFSFSLV